MHAGSLCAIAVAAPPSHPPPSLQGQLLMLVMELMRGGDLHSALQRPDTRDALRWAARSGQGKLCWQALGGGLAALCLILSRAGKLALHKLCVFCSFLAPTTHLPICSSTTCRGRQVALDVAEALAFLHSCGVQHADLKPRWGGSWRWHAAPCIALAVH